MTTILLAEDHHEVCEFLKVELTEGGFKVQIVHDGSLV